jgi:hypothetical protein
MKLARTLLADRRDAYVHLARKRADAEVRSATEEFWRHVERVAGFREDEDKLTAILVAGGVPDSQARRWSREIVRDEEDDGIELRAPLVCAHCGSAMSQAKTECGVCGQPRGSAPEPDRADDRAQHLVRALIASGRLKLVSASAESAVVDDTAVLLNEHLDDPPAAVAEMLLDGWTDREDVAEVFADVDELVSALERA